MNLASSCAASCGVDSSAQCQSLRSPAWKMVLPSSRVMRYDTPASVEPYALTFLTPGTWSTVSPALIHATSNPFLGTSLENMSFERI